ncbi:MAG: hypothetical protein IPF62_00685 [Bacteroidetes bacterium]|nr:hypothetical protein [Bacteroidota bacterium]
MTKQHAHFSLFFIMLITFLLSFPFVSFAQFNTDGSYTLKMQDGKTKIYYPQIPDAKGKQLDTLSVMINDKETVMLYSIAETKNNDRVFKNKEAIEASEMQKMTNDNGTVTTFYSIYPECDCMVDTLLMELPDGTFKYYFTVKNENHNRLSKGVMVQTANKNMLIDVYENTDEMPSFRGGKAAIVQYIKKNIKFNNQGKRYLGSFNIQFIVLANGKITQILFDKEYTTPPLALENDLKRILKSMPQWKPGMMNGKAVNVFYTLQLNLAI